MSILDWLSGVGFVRTASKSFRKRAVKARCSRCRRKTVHNRAADDEELEFRTDFYQTKSVVRRGITYVSQKVGVGEVFNHLDDYYVYRCSKCGRLRALNRSACF